jgi:hypothetical protein
MSANLHEKDQRGITNVSRSTYYQMLKATIEVMKSNLNRVLLCEFVQACRRSGEIREFFMGQLGGRSQG